MCSETTISNKKSLFVDVGDLNKTGLQITGIQRVTLHLVRELSDPSPVEYHMVPVYRHGRSLRLARIFCNTFFPDIIDGMEFDFVKIRQGDIYLAMDINLVGRANELTRLVGDIKAHGATVFFLLHDLMPVTHKEFFPAVFSRNFEDWLHVIAREADGLIAVSDTTKNSFTSWLRETDIRCGDTFLVSKIPLSSGLGVEHSNGPGNLMRFAARTSQDTMFLMVGTVRPHKGYRQAAGAFELLWQDGIPASLMVIGGSVCGETQKILDGLSCHRQFEWLKGANDETLTFAYKASSAVICASYCEGFGLPLVEAAALGRPIIAREIDIFREVAGNHAYFFNGKTPQDLAGAIKRWMDLNDRGEVPRPTNMKVASWRDSAVALCGTLFRHRRIIAKSPCGIHD